MGDFNGHIGFLGLQPINKNGELMLDLIDNNNLILLNGHADCREGNCLAPKRMQMHNRLLNPLTTADFTCFFSHKLKIYIEKVNS